jgi:hypothetical protein
MLEETDLEQKPPPEKEAIVLILERLVSDDKENSISKGSRFHALKIPRISLLQYLDRLIRYCPASPCVWVVSLIYLCRLATKCQEGFINPNTIHRQLMACVVVASKFCDDFFETNLFYSRVGGISLVEMNALEIELLARLNFDLSVTEAEIRSYEGYINTSYVLSLGKQKGKLPLQAFNPLDQVAHCIPAS